MAKKTQREMILLKCTICKNQNYQSERNKISTPDKLALDKFCRFCRKITAHKETKGK